MTRRVAGLFAIFSACAANRGYFYHDEKAGYPARPGTGSARVMYSDSSSSVVGTTNSTEGAINASSDATLRSAEADVRRAHAETIRSRNRITEECFRRYGPRCYYGYGGHYSVPGYTHRGIEIGKSAQAENDALVARIDAARARKMAREALRGAKKSARLVLRQSDAVERAFSEAEEDK